MNGAQRSLFGLARRDRRRRLARLVRLIVGGVVILLVVGGLGATAVWHYTRSQIEARPLTTLAAREPAAGAATLLVAVEGGGAPEVHSMTLLQAGRDRFTLVAFPPDLGVTPRGQERSKLAEVYARKGVEGLVATVADYTGLRVQHYVLVEAAAFGALAEVLDGVEMCPEDAEEAPARPTCPVVGPEQAKALVTGEPAAAVGDSSVRLARQQSFLRAAMDQATSVATALDPARVKGLVDVVADHVATDVELGVGTLWQLAMTLRETTPEMLDVRIIPGSRDSAATFTHVFPEQAEALFQAVRSGEPLPDVGRTDPQDSEVTADQVEVVVLNGVGEDGLAAEVADFLAEREFVVVGADDAQEFDAGMARTTVAHGPESAVKAQLVASFLPGASVIATDPPVRGDVVVTVANDWSPS